jgi:DNA-binding Xre family transcriptional regulator
MKKNSAQYFDYLNVPVALCEYALEFRKTNQVRLYLYLKSVSNGFIKNESKIYTEAAKELNVCSKSISNHLKWLKNQGWIIQDLQVNSICIISFERLAEKLNFQSATGVIIYKTELKEFKFIAIVSVIEYNMKRMRIRRRKSATELKPWNSKLQKFPSYPHLPHTYLGKVLGVSKTTASRYKKLAKKRKYLLVKKRFDNLGIPAVNMSELKKYGPYESDKLKNIKNKIVEQLPDELTCNVTLRKKYNLRNVCSKNRSEKKREPLNVDTFNQLLK